MPFKKRKRLPIKQWEKLRSRGRSALRRFGKEKRGNKYGQRFSFQKKAKKIGGSSSKSSKSLVIATPPSDAGATSKQEYPHPTFIKYYLCSNSLTHGPTDGFNEVAANYPGNANAYATIGVQDRIYTPKMLRTNSAWMMLDLFNPNRIWSRHPTGNSLLPPKYTGIADGTTPLPAVTPLDHLHCSFAMNNAAAGAAWTPIMITQDRIPQSIVDPYKIAENLGAQTIYHTPDTVITGVDVDLTIDSMCMGDQVVTVKLCRLVDQGGFGGGGEWVTSMSELQRTSLLNSPDSTDGRIWETVWSETHQLPCITPFQSTTQRLLRVKKHISTNYLRTTTQLELLGVEYSSGLDAMYGNNKMPTLKSQTSTKHVDHPMKNNLALAIICRSKDDYVPVKTESGLSAAVVGAASTTVVASSHTEGVSLEKMTSKAAGESVARFGVSGTVTERFRCRDFVNQAHDIPLMTTLAPAPAPILPSLSDHNDTPSDNAPVSAEYNVLTDTEPVAVGIIAADGVAPLLPSEADNDDTPIGDAAPAADASSAIVPATTTL